MGKKNKSKESSNTIALNKKAKFDFFIEERLEAGMVLQGWEVKSLREKRINLSESYVLLKDGEAWLIGCHISPLNTVSTHIHADPIRTRKLLLHNKELAKLFAYTERQGYTVAALALYWKNNRVKCEIGIAKGKKMHDKRATEKQREWNRDKERIMKSSKR